MKIIVRESEVQNLLEILGAGATAIGRREDDADQYKNYEELHRLYKVRQFAYQFKRRIEAELAYLKGENKRRCEHCQAQGVVRIDH